MRNSYSLVSKTSGLKPEVFYSELHKKWGKKGRFVV